VEKKTTESRAGRTRLRGKREWRGGCGGREREREKEGEREK